MNFTKKILKRLSLFVATVIAAMLVTVPAFAAELNIIANYIDDTLTINLSDVTTYSCTYHIFSLENPSTALYTEKITIQDSCGSATISFNQDSGQYRIAIYNTGGSTINQTFSWVSANDRSDFIATLQSCTDTEQIRECFDNNETLLSICPQYTYYSENEDIKTNVIDIFTGIGTNFSDFAEFSAAFEDYVIFARLNYAETAEDVISILSDKLSLVDSEAQYSYYNDSTDIQNSAAGRFTLEECDNIYNHDDIRNIFNINVLLARVEFCEPSDFDSIIRELGNYMDIARYENHSDQQSIADKMSGQSYQTIYDFEEALHQSTLSDEDYHRFLEELANFGNADEIRDFLLQNTMYFSDASQFKYFEADTDVQNIVSELFASDRTGFGAIDEFKEYFNKHVVFARIAGAPSASEIDILLSEYPELVSDSNQFSYFNASADIQNYTSQLLVNHDYRNYDELTDCFSQCVLLARVKVCDGSHDDFNLIMDDMAVYTDIRSYTSLDEETYQPRVASIMSGRLFYSMSDFRDELENTAKSIAPGNGSSGGAAGGGGGRGPVRLYTVTPDGEAIEEAPEAGTKVKLVLSAQLVCDPGVVYTVAIYDSNKNMKAIKLFNSTATAENQTEFFEFETVYDPDYEIKIFTLSDLESITPARECDSMPFIVDGEVPPEAEPETEGVTAYKGTIVDITPEYFTLNRYEMRAFGYWGVPVTDEEPIKVYYDDEDIILYNIIGGEVFNIRENDGEYTLESLEYEGEVITFTPDDVDDCTLSSLILYDGENYNVYKFSQSFELYTDGNIYSASTVESLLNYFKDKNIKAFNAYITDGTIRCVNSVDGDMDASKITYVGGGKYILENGLSLDEDAVLGEAPEVGDVALIRCFNSREWLTKAAAPKQGTFTGLGVMVDGVEYEIEAPIPYILNIEEVVNVYFDATGKRAMYAEKLYDNKELIILTEISTNEFGSTQIKTQDKIIAIDKDISFDGMIIHQDSAYNHLQNYLGLVMYYSETENYIAFDSLTLQASAAMQYKQLSADVGILGDYIVNKDTVIWAKTDYGYFKDVVLKANYLYTADIFSNKDSVAEFIIIDDPAAETVTEKIYMILENITGEEILGYWNGERVSIAIEAGAYDFSNIGFGDIIYVSVIKDEVLDISRLCSFSDMALMSNELRSGFVTNIIDDVIIIDGLTSQAVLADSNTSFYIIDSGNCTIELADKSDIIFNDQVIIYHKNNAALEFLIVK